MNDKMSRLDLINQKMDELLSIIDEVDSEYFKATEISIYEDIHQIGNKKSAFSFFKSSSENDRKCNALLMEIDDFWKLMSYKVAEYKSNKIKEADKFYDRVYKDLKAKHPDMADSIDKKIKELKEEFGLND